MAVFHRARIGSTTVASGYTAGSGSLSVVDGSQFGSTFPIVVIVSRAGVRMSVLEVTARATNTLTVSGAVDGTTDVNLLVGDVVKEGPTALQTNELQDAINALPAYDRFSNLTVAEVAITGTTALTSAAFGKMHICSGTSADYTVTLPAPSGNTGRFIGFRMSPALTRFVTIAHNASETINGSASRLMWANEVATLLCDGANWNKVSGVSIPMVCWILNSSPTYLTDNISTKMILDTAQLDNTGKMADTTNRQMVIRRNGVYSISQNLLFNSVSYSATALVVIYVNGSSTATNALYCVSGSSPTFFVISDSNLGPGTYLDLRVQMANPGSTQSVWANLTAKEQNPW